MDISRLPPDMREFAQKIKNTEPLMKDIAGLFLKRTIKKWEIRGEGREYQGVKWPPLAESTVKAFARMKETEAGAKRTRSSKGKRRGKEHMLEDRGHMLAALTTKTDSTKAKIFFLSPEGKKYFKHHFGTENIPARPVLDVTKEDEKALDKELDRFIKESWRSI